LWGAGVGWPGFQKVAEAGGRFVAPTEEEAARIRAKHAFLKPLSIPAGSYPGQSEPIRSVGSWSFVMARPDLPEETGYRLARALHEAEPDLAHRLPQAAETTSANTAAAAPDPSLLQPGVARYLREIGALK
jgi:TRAP transporter TAXI family solute receptor